MPISSHQTKKSALEFQLAELTAEYTATNKQLTRTVNDVDRRRLRAQMDDLEIQMRDVENDLQELEHTFPMSSHSHEWHTHLPRINFREAVSISEEVLLNCSSSCAALFLVPNSLSMGGSWCVTRIRELIKQTTSDLRNVVLEHTATSQFSERWLLDGLARYLRLDPHNLNRQDIIPAIIEKFVGSVRSGSVLFFEIRGWEFDQDNPEMLTWLVNEFWIPLTKALGSLEPSYSRLRTVLFIIADEPLPKHALPSELCCTRSAFRAEKILELPLQNWTLDEIHDWLESYSRLKTQEISKLARKIYGASSRGVPALVYQALNHHLRRRDSNA